MAWQLINQSTQLGFKFQELPRAEGFYLSITLKFFPHPSRPALGYLALFPGNKVTNHPHQAPRLKKE
jgi:hypothetical protein